MSESRTSSHRSVIAARCFSAGDRVCTEHFAAATVLAVNTETGEITVRRTRDNREVKTHARNLIKITGTIGERVPA